MTNQKPTFKASTETLFTSSFWIRTTSFTGQADWLPERTWTRSIDAGHTPKSAKFLARFFGGFAELSQGWRVRQFSPGEACRVLTDLSFFVTRSGRVDRHQTNPKKLDAQNFALCKNLSCPLKPALLHSQKGRGLPDPQRLKPLGRTRSRVTGHQ